MLAKASAKLLLFFDICKRLAYFFAFYAFFLKFDIPSIEKRHALKSQINALSDHFHISPARDYTREDKKKRPRKVASTRSVGTIHVAQQR